jgi:hypothetical protein
MMACFDDAPANEREYVARIAALVKPAPKAHDRFHEDDGLLIRFLIAQGRISDWPSDKAGETQE